MSVGKLNLAMLNTQLKGWRKWGLLEKPELVKTFNAGKNHHTALIKSGTSHYVVKVFEHSFEHAISAQRWAAEQGLAPAIIYAQDSLALMDYIESEDHDSHQALASLAGALHTLHNATAAKLADFDMLAFCNDYLENAPQGVRADHLNLRPALDIFLNDSTPWVVCHNDLVRENCLFASHRAWFIDWEYALLNNPWFDLAAVILYFNLDLKQAEDFLERYTIGWGSHVGKPIYYAAQLCLLWADLLWHIDKFGHQYQTKNAHRFDKLRGLAHSLSIKLPA